MRAWPPLSLRAHHADELYLHIPYLVAVWQTAAVTGGYGGVGYETSKVRDLMRCMIELRQRC